MSECGTFATCRLLPEACFRFSGRVLGVTMLVKGREGPHALVCLGRRGACCGDDSRR